MKVISHIHRYSSTVTKSEAGAKENKTKFSYFNYFHGFSVSVLLCLSELSVGVGFCTVYCTKHHRLWKDKVKKGNIKKKKEKEAKVDATTPRCRYKTRK
ncbi:hypothetical protein P175DRAFT_0371385 [Aspergillus ochraceoroseus IBT 24754]|uniref:Uncharacterized protein n=1 Tax=Aspergillus ochraceoroseus IBT 24754 TaxID=1392256 RepID=A0A2T5LMZ8_9EURO|nr:uncharacterized protein P175DRAFT_0371385 [Aspergillus ochraceoroseus IBT 24754]PTU17653.1 hypothetical protein P175DRAFT_0371385 [Aspergillus ochraceoroseus IBT 24754]